MIREVEAGVAADEEARLAAQKAAEERAAEWKRQEEEKRARWQAAIADARVHAIEKLRQDAFRSAHGAWTAATEIRAFCLALEDEHHAQDGADNLARWIAWAREAADRIDPTRGPSTLADISFDVDPQPQDLRPFLGDWSPYQPQREYRTERDEQALADIRAHTKAWHHGMRGQRRPWRN